MVSLTTFTQRSILFLESAVAGVATVLSSKTAVDCIMVVCKGYNFRVRKMYMFFKSRNYFCKVLSPDLVINVGETAR